MLGIFDQVLGEIRLSPLPVHAERETRSPVALPLLVSDGAGPTSGH